jgi:hypothetical protein
MVVSAVDIRTTGRAVPVRKAALVSHAPIMIPVLSARTATSLRHTVSK